MHGGDIYRNKVELDFSVNINPLGMPAKAWEAILESKDSLLNYPDISCQKLCGKIADYHKIKPENVVCGNGASELIWCICVMSKADKALLNAPSFSGYERSLNSLGIRIQYNFLNAAENFMLTDIFAEKIRVDNPQLVFVTNPNNPDGNLVCDEVRKKIINECQNTGAILIVDECFLEMTKRGEDASFLNELTKADNAIVLRAFTKSYGMPGLRLAYAICSNEELANKLSKFVPEWNVSSLAQEAGCQVIGDKAFLKASQEVIETERVYLEKELSKLGMKVYPSQANYILFEDSKNPDGDLYGRLLERGILIRDCSDYMGLKKGHYRIAVKNHECNIRLIKCINEVKGSGY